jgi:hypothetical protein
VRHFSGAAHGLGERAGSRLAVYFVLCTSGKMGVFSCGAGVWRCSVQVVCVRCGRSPFGGVGDGKVVGGYRWESWGFCLLGVLGVLFGCWPFLEFTVVYWCCPCAGRHLLSLHAAKKVGKESGFTPPAHKRLPWLGGGSGPSGISARAHSAPVTKPSSAPTAHCVRRGWVCVGNQRRWSCAVGLSASPRRGVQMRCVGRGRPDEKSEWHPAASCWPAFKASGRAHAEKISSRF